MNTKKTPTHVRVSSLAKLLDTVQNTIELFGGEKKEGARIALDAVRREYGIPLSGQQLTLFDESGRRKK